MKAINNFDVHYGVQFSTYAVPIIMGEIKRYFRDDGTIKVSRSLKELNIKINKTKEKLTVLYGKEPTVKDIADELEVDVMDVIEAIDASYYQHLYQNQSMKKMVQQFQWKKESKISDMLCGLKR